MWLYKVRAKPLTENYATKEGTTITRQTGDVEWTAIKRTHDGRYQAVADEGENGFTAEKGETFLQSVYTPVINCGLRFRQGPARNGARFQNVRQAGAPVSGCD